MRIRSTTSITSLGLGLLIALTGCSSGTDGGNGNTGNGNAGSGVPFAGTGTGAGVGGSVVAGTGVAGTGVGQAGAQAGAPAAGAGGPSEFGTGGTPAAGVGGVAGTAGDTVAGAGGTAGTAGDTVAGAGGTPSTGTCDTSTFLTDCQQGGQYWGTPQQAGPCSQGTTTYGVTSTLGPYGVRSEYNVGANFNTGNGVGDFAICPIFIDSFGADPKGSADLKDTHDLNFGLYTVFYPGCMPDGEKFPLVTWANGTCAMPEGYGPLLRNLASYGYIVVAPNSVQTGSGAQQVKAIDFMTAENSDPNSKYYQHVDLDNIGAMGHSQGGMSTVAASADPRIKSVILWNGGSSASKPFLAVSGDRDIAGTVDQLRNAANAAPRPAAWLWYHQIPAAVDGSTTGTLAPGHLTLMMESERVNDVTVAWWDMMLKGKQEAKQMFIGTGCTLCDGSAYSSMWSPPTSGSAASPSIEFGHNAMLQ